MLIPLSCVLSLGNEVPVVSFCSLGSPILSSPPPPLLPALPDFWYLLGANRVVIEPAPPRKQLQIPLAAPAPQLPLSFGSKMGGMSKPWLVFPAWPNPTSSPILEKQEETASCPNSSALPFLVCGTLSDCCGVLFSLTLALRR